MWDARCGRTSRGRDASCRIRCRPGERLRAYAAWCNAVEGNTTFYATPARSTVESWARQTDPDFRFVVKLPKSITHERRLTGVDAELRAFLRRDRAARAARPCPLDPVAGVVRPRPTSRRSAGFLRRLPTSHRYAVEVRHRAFFDDARSARLLERVLAGVGAEWVPFDTTALFQQPADQRRRTGRVDEEAAHAAPDGRAHRPPDRALPRPGRHRATVEGWQPWLDTVTGWLREGRSPTVFVHTPTTPTR